MPEASHTDDRKYSRCVNAGFSVAERLSYVVVSLRETSELKHRFLL